jgi:hypothetical protein
VDLFTRFSNLYEKQTVLDEILFDYLALVRTILEDETLAASTARLWIHPGLKTYPYSPDAQDHCELL